MAMIEAAGLARVFRSRRQTVEAVRGVDITVAEGEIVGFLGPNGAGKTTTLRMLTTLLRPTAGTATVAGADLLRDPVEVRRRIGYVAQAIGVTAGGSDPNCLVSEELQIQAQLYRIPAAEAARRIALLLDQLELAGLEKRLCKTLSGGQRRRLDIALGLVHSPRLVFLDEPSTGLDPQSRSNLWDHIRALRDELGTTVFLTTHYLEEADALCDRVLVIDHGKIIAEGVPDELKHRDLRRRGHAQLRHPGQRGERGAGAGRRTRTSRTSRRTAPACGSASTAASRPCRRCCARWTGAGLTLESVQLARPTLDDVFLTLTGRSLRDDSPVQPGRDSEPELASTAS